MTIRTVRAENISMAVGEDPSYTWEIRDFDNAVANVSTATALYFTVINDDTGVQQFQKTGAAFVITDGPNGLVTVSIAEVDTESVTPSSTDYSWDAWITIGGNDFQFARGRFILRPRATVVP